jgi:hypothetical protein
MRRLPQKGRYLAEVARRSSGTASHIEQCHIAMFLAHASRYGHVLRDRELYLPDE